MKKRDDARPPARSGARTHRTGRRQCDQCAPTVLIGIGRINVWRDCNIADALNASGIPMPTSCVSGLCGTSKLRLQCGEVDRKDYILSEEERTEYLTCVSRARSGVLVLDL
jgi:ferredoxin